MSSSLQTKGGTSESFVDHDVLRRAVKSRIRRPQKGRVIKLGLIIA
jgi:hypothetical protein